VAVVTAGEAPDTLVVVKPAGLACEVPRNAAADSLVRRLARQGALDLRLPHRLDALACGLVLLARSRAAAAHYTQEIEARRWLRVYVARLAASFPEASTLVGPHKAYLKTAGRRAEVVRSGGKPSFLDVVAAAPVPDAVRESHVVVRLHSGRFHQIRAMLSHLGTPLVGDVHYGGPPGRPVYLEHALLGAHVFGTGAWTVWTGPSHPDRDGWGREIVAAIDIAAQTPALG
jgi:23S rRNA pseudouridine1911/1915/1917 synthase